MEALETKRIGKYEIEIHYDENPIDPRENDNLGTMVCFHRRYNLGDRHGYRHEDYNSWSEMKAAIEKNEDVAVILPLYLYDHSGITMNTTGFSCGWDSGQVGWIFISKKKVREEYRIKVISKQWKERIAGYLKAEVEEYDKYLTGDVYRYTVYEVSECNMGCEHRDVVEACCGFQSEELAMEDAEDIVNHYIKKEADVQVL